MLREGFISIPKLEEQEERILKSKILRIRGDQFRGDETKCLREKDYGFLLSCNRNSFVVRDTRMDVSTCFPDIHCIIALTQTNEQCVILDHKEHDP